MTGNTLKKRFSGFVPEAIKALIYFNLFKSFGNFAFGTLDI